MTTSRLQKLQQIGVSFDQPAPDLVERERRRLRKICDQIFRAALGRVDRIADHYDTVNALRPKPIETMALSETFSKRYGDLMLEIDVEWLADRPDLEQFTRLVCELEDLCLLELRSQIAKL